MMDFFEYLYFILSYATLFLGCSKIYELIKAYSLREDSDGKFIVSHRNRDAFLLFVAILLVLLFIALTSELAVSRKINLYE